MFSYHYIQESLLSNGFKAGPAWAEVGSTAFADSWAANGAKADGAQKKEQADDKKDDKKDHKKDDHKDNKSPAVKEDSAAAQWLKLLVTFLELLAKLFG